MPTGKAMTNSHVANKTTVTIVRGIVGNSLIDCTQVQVDSIIYVHKGS